MLSVPLPILSSGPAPPIAPPRPSVVLERTLRMPPYWSPSVTARLLSKEVVVSRMPALKKVRPPVASPRLPSLATVSVPVSIVVPPR